MAFSRVHVCTTKEEWDELLRQHPNMNPNSTTAFFDPKENRSYFPREFSTQTGCHEIDHDLQKQNQNPRTFYRNSRGAKEGLNELVAAMQNPDASGRYATNSDYAPNSASWGSMLKSVGDKTGIPREELARSIEFQWEWSS